tara:strand:- start:106 stop:1008 length:903 start_codon:yes stop_codon:yes gene_type:complete
MALYNNISQDFYNNINNFGSNPFVLVILVFIIIIYYILFSFLGKSSTDNSNGGFFIIEALLWGIFIVLIFVNGLSYFFGINVITELKNLFSNEPEINISTVVDDIQDISPDISLNVKEVYHVPGNKFSYHDAKAICNAFDGEMATYKQLNESQKKGASWCSYGWTKDQLGLYPTSQSDWNKLQEKEGHEYDCGIPGINGGYIANPYITLGANCYGVKPKKSKLESEYENKDLYPKTKKEQLFEERVNYWRNRMGNIIISPFNHSNWYKNTMDQIASNFKNNESVKNNITSELDKNNNILD